MDGKPETREYLRLCQKQWHWILDNYDRLIKEGYEGVWALKREYFNEQEGLDQPKNRCYLCELTDLNCLECPLSGIAWKKDHSCPCVNDEDSVYWRITYLMNDGRYEESSYKEAKDAIKEFLSIIDNECRRW